MAIGINLSLWIDSGHSWVKTRCANINWQTIYNMNGITAAVFFFVFFFFANKCSST